MTACKFCGCDLDKISAPCGRWDHVQACELTQLRVLRDLLIEWNKRNNRQSIDAPVARDAIIARAEELAKDPWPPSS